MKKNISHRYVLIALLSIAGMSQFALSNAADQPSIPPIKKIQSGNPPPVSPNHVPPGPNQVAIAPLAICATGFNKTGEKKVLNGALENFQCTTPVITCPKNPSYTTSSLDVEIISNNPEQAAKSIRYTCKYWTPQG